MIQIAIDASFSNGQQAPDMRSNHRIAFDCAMVLKEVYSISKE